MRETALTRAWGMPHPIVQAPMAGASTVELAAAVGEAGGLGFIACAYLTPDEIVTASAALRARTASPFGVNLFAPTSLPAPPRSAPEALAHVAGAHAALGLPTPTLPDRPTISFDDQVDACLESGARVCSFTFGIPSAALVAAIRERGMAFVGTATSVVEARLLERAGAEAIVAQGSEAGAHRGTFTGDFEATMIGTMALVPQVVDAVQVPVLASGGIMDGRGVAAALALGADAVQVGTVFLTCAESAVPEVHKEAILRAGAHETRVTRAFSGRPARGIVNAFMDGVDADPVAILPFPYQNALTRPMRTAAAAQGRADYLSLWSGQGVGMARREDAAQTVVRLVREMEEVVGRLSERP